MALPFYFGMAGAAIGALDALVLARASASAPTMGAVWALDAFTGMLVGALAVIFLRFGDGLYRLPGERAPRALVDGLLSALAAVPLGITLFSGRGVSRTLLGELGPYVFPVISLLAATLAALLLRRAFAEAGRSGPGRRLLIAAPLALASAALLAADRRYFPGLYVYLHVLLALGALSLLGAALRLFWTIPPRRGIALAFLIPVSLMGLGVVAGAPVPNAERPAAFANSLLASRAAETVWHFVDLDHDGFSPLLGGGDCDDLDASVNPVGFDITKNGVDEDCDGADPTPFLRIVARPYRTDPAVGRRIAVEAVKRPTVLIIVDALRADRIGLPRFPNLARLARESLDFTRVYTPATRTSLAIPAIATGHSIFSRDEPTVAERLRAAGKRTALVTINHVSRFLSFYGGLGFAMERGFDEALLVPDRPLQPGQAFDGLGGHLDYWTGGDVTAEVLALLERPAPPDFIWVHYFDLHQWSKLRMKGLEEGAPPANRYDAVLEALDGEVGRLLEYAADFNLVLTADHGEALGESGRLFHGGYLSREEVRVPLLVRVPGVPPGRVDVPVALTDLAPTLCQLTGAGGDDAWTARSLLPLAGATDPGTGPPILMFESREWSIVEGRWRLVLSLKGGARRLYDIESDPLERTNLADEKSEETERLSRLLLQLAALARVDHPDYAPIREEAGNTLSAE